MDPFTIAIIADTVMNTAQSIFGGNETTTEQKLSPEAKAYLQMLYNKLRGPTPGYLTDPIRQTYATARSGIKESMGQALGPGSGLEVAQMLRSAAGESRAVGNIGEQYRAGIRSDIGGVVGGTGIQTTTQPRDFSGSGEDLGWLLYALTNKKQSGGSGSSGGGMSYSPGFLGGY